MMTVERTDPRTFSSQEKLARNITLITMLVMIGVSLLTLFIPSEGKTPIDNFAMPFVAIGAGVAFLFSRQHKAVLGIYVLLGTVAFTALAYAFVIDNIGWQTAIGMLIIVTSISNGTLDAKEAQRISAFAFIFGVAIVFLDLFSTGMIKFETTVSSYIVTAVLAFVFFGLILYRFPQFPLRTKFNIAFFVLSIISIAATTIAINRTMQSLTNRQLEEQFSNITNLTSASVSAELEQQIGVVRALSFDQSIALGLAKANARAETNPSELLKLDEQWIAAYGNENDPLIKSVLNNSVSTVLVEFQEAFPDHVEVFVTDQYGAVVAASNQTSDYSQADEEWWQAAYNNGQGELFISQPVFDESSQSLSLQISVPVYTGNTNTVAGILRTTVSVSILEDAFQKGTFGETGRAEIYLPNGMELEAEKTSDGITTINLEEANPVFVSGFAEDNVLYDLDHNGEEVLAVMQPLASGEITDDNTRAIQNLNWRVAAIQNRDEALQGIAEAVRNAQVAGLWVLLVAALLAIVMTNVITTPIMRLKDAAEQVSSGNLDTLAKVETTDELGLLGEAFNRMTRQLQESLAGLERRVVERTTDLELARHLSEKRAGQLLAIGEISKVINSEQNLSNLLTLVTHLVSERFGFYHTGIFLLDETKQFAVLRAANSEGGKRMLKRIHKLKVGESGIVGFVAKSGTSRIALDVGLDAVYFNNPDLPQTRSEMALPLNHLDTTIGVLDVQSERPGAFTEEDANLLNILSDQIAIAIQNARLFEQTQQTLGEIQALYRQTLQSGWRAFTGAEEMVGYEQSLTGGRKLTQPMETVEIQQAINRGDSLVFHADGKSGDPTLVLPIKLRGQVIGVIHIKSPTRNRQWTTDEINLTEAVSERLSIALENARLIQDSQQKATIEQTISEITGRISSSINLENVLQTTVEELGRTIPGSEVVIKLSRTDSNNGNGLGNSR